MFCATARVAPKKQDMPACLPLAIFFGLVRASMEAIKPHGAPAEGAKNA